MSEDGTIGGQDGDPTAAEYVLGVLSAEERLAFEHRLAAEPALAADVAFWEQRLVGMAAEVRSIAPPLGAWNRIETALGNVAPRTPAREGASFWQNLAFWRWCAIGAGAIAAASLAALIITGLVLTQPAPLIARLDANGQAGFVAAVDLTRGSLTIVPASLKPVDQRALQLWVIAPGDRPRSLGLIQPAQATHVNLAPDLAMRVAPDAVLAVSVEPPGGSPTGLPTGPVIANGKLTTL
jgi:anti-sigma-K factor RskA